MRVLFPLGLLLIAVPLRAQDGASADQHALQGEWTMVSASVNGATYPNTTGTRHVVGDTTTVIVNGQLLMQAVFSVDPSASPKSIDYSVFAGALNGAHLLGIYRLDGSTLTFCMTSPGGIRPTGFETENGDGRTCTVWRKER